MVEGARLESEYTAKPYRGFESLPLRHPASRRCAIRPEKPSYSTSFVISPISNARFGEASQARCMADMGACPSSAHCRFWVDSVEKVRCRFGRASFAESGKVQPQRNQCLSRAARAGKSLKEPRNYPLRTFSTASVESGRCSLLRSAECLPSSGSKRLRSCPFSTTPGPARASGARLSAPAPLPRRDVDRPCAPAGRICPRCSTHNVARPPG